MYKKSQFTWKGLKVRPNIDDSSYYIVTNARYKGDPLPPIPEMENARGKVNIVIFSGKYHVSFRLNILALNK